MGRKGQRGYIKTGAAAAGLFRHSQTKIMNKTIIQFHNKTATNLHDHEHVHLHGPGDWTSIIIVVIIVTGIIIVVVVVACLVSIEKLKRKIKNKKRGDDLAG